MKIIYKLIKLVTMEDHKGQIIEFLKASKLNFESGFYDISAFLAEEALHLYLVTSSLKYNVVVPWYLDFDALLRILEKHEPRFKEIRKERAMIKFFDQIRIEFRYSVPMKIDKETAEKVISFVESIINLDL